MSIVAKRSPISATAEHLFVFILCFSIFLLRENNVFDRVLDTVNPLMKVLEVMRMFFCRVI